MAQPIHSDEQLAKKAIKGNRKAFTALFNRYFQAVYNFALSLSNDPAQAEDLTQEAFIRAHRNLDRFGPPWNFKAWIFRLTRNYFIDLYRKEAHVDPLEEGDPVISPTPGPERVASSRDAANRVQSTLARLSAQQREILVLRELNEFSYAEIGEILNLSLSNVKVSLHRARAAFQESYGIHLLLEDPTGDCQDVAGLLHSLHDREELFDQERFAREHLKTCQECQERQKVLIAQSVAFGAFVPVVPPPDLAERILEKTSGASGGGSGSGNGPLQNILGYGGGAAVLGLMVWLAFMLVFNTEKILPNFPRNGAGLATPAVLAPAAPTETPIEAPPPPPPPLQPTEDERCTLFEEIEISLVMLNIIDGTYNIPVYLKMADGVPGGPGEEGSGETLWPYSAWLGEIPAYKCDLQGFPDRLYCMFTLMPDMPGTEQFFQLENGEL